MRALSSFIGLAVVLSPAANSDYDRLARRVDQLEKQVQELNKAVSQLQKELTKGSQAEKSGDKKVADDLKRLTDQVQRNEKLEYNRVRRLAEWFDQYHPKDRDSTYHRREAERVK